MEFNFEIQYKPAEQLIVPDSLSRGFGFMVFNATFNNISVISPIPLLDVSTAR
jgi:hypothetical protein